MWIKGLRAVGAGLLGRTIKGSIWEMATFTNLGGLWIVHGIMVDDCTCNNVTMCTLI